MKIFSTASLLALGFVGVCAGPARAQSVVDAKVPFSFLIGHRAFAAGRYEVDIDRRGMVAVHGLDKPSADYSLSVAVAGHDPAGDRPSLVFRRYENTYQLIQVWNGRDDGVSVGLPTRGAPRTGERAPAAGEATYVLAANSR